jgi:hypothetical protein
MSPFGMSAGRRVLCGAVLLVLLWSAVYWATRR